VSKSVSLHKAAEFVAHGVNADDVERLSLDDEMTIVIIIISSS